MFFLAEPDIRQWMIDWNEGAASSLQMELPRQTAVLLPLLTASSIKKDKRNKHKCPRSRDRTYFVWYQYQQQWYSESEYLSTITDRFSYQEYNSDGDGKNFW